MKFPQSHISVNPQNPRNNSFSQATHPPFRPVKASCIGALFYVPRLPGPRPGSVSAIATNHSPVISQFRAPTRFRSRLCKMWMELCDLEARKGNKLGDLYTKNDQNFTTKGALCWDGLPTSITIKRLRGPWRVDTFFLLGCSGGKSYSNSSGKSQFRELVFNDGNKIRNQWAS